jgi:hypothetical protein
MPRMNGLEAARAIREIERQTGGAPAHHRHDFSPHARRGGSLSSRRHGGLSGQAHSGQRLV